MFEVEKTNCIQRKGLGLFVNQIKLFMSLLWAVHSLSQVLESQKVF